MSSTPFNQVMPSFYTWADTILSCSNQITLVKGSSGSMDESSATAKTPRDMETDQNEEEHEYNLDSAMNALCMDVTVDSLHNFFSAYMKKK